MSLEVRLRAMLAEGRLDLPLPGRGRTPERHLALAGIAREDLSVARLAEAHTDAVAILAEAGRVAVPGALYGVWAAETRSHPLKWKTTQSGFALQGSKVFCTGAGLVDRALVTVRDPEERLVDVDLKAVSASIEFDTSGWIAEAFAETQTGITTFRDTAVGKEDLICTPGWYLKRPGFWHGACGPAACWAGGALGLVDYARAQPKPDAQGAAHLGAMGAAAWALKAYLDISGQEIDADPDDAVNAQRRALTVRHLVEQSCTDILTRFGRAFGPRPLAFDAAISRRYQELSLYIRQCHAERDLESLGLIPNTIPRPA
jgi:alkylation response protein AidB-like acyl-CoA dehydrogenase